MRLRNFALVLLLASLCTCASPGRDGLCALSIALEEEGRSVPGLVRFEGAVPEGLLSRGLGLEEKHPAKQWFVVPGPCTAWLPRGRVTVTALHGLETEAARLELDLTGREVESVRIPLVRFHDARKRGWTGANTHLHLQKISREEADRYLTEVPRADGLDALFVSYLERAEADREYVSNGYGEADLRALTERSGVLFGNGEEHRHNFTGFGEGYGHVMFLNLPVLVRPVSIGPGIMKSGTDAPPLQDGIDQARKQGASIVWCHNTFGLEDIPNWVAGKIHAQNIFDGDPATHGTYKDTYYRYLNAGLRVPFSTGTDWFLYDFSRAYAAVADPRTPRDWLEALEAGKTFITNGPFLEFEAGGRGPGETVALPEPGKLSFRLRAAGRVDFRKVELIRNGETVLTAAAHAEGGHFVATLTGKVDVAAPCWLALRTPPPPTTEQPDPGHPLTELGGPLFAHTSAVQVEVGGKRVFDRAAAAGLLDELRRAKGAIEKAAVFANDHDREHVLGVYAVAARTLEKMLER